IWRASEPGTPHPRMRLQAVRRLNEAGVRCGVLLAPILPGLSDLRDQLQEVVEGCVAAGAVSVTPIVLHLRPGVDEHYLSWLDSWRPDLAEECRRRYRGRAYLPRAEQAALQGLVGDLLRQARGRSGSSGGRPSPSGGPRGRGGGRR
ncbi:MAG: radical SAM protein, partial [Acidimicrobiales bacterium]